MKLFQIFHALGRKFDIQLRYDRLPHPAYTPPLHLHLGKTVLPDSDEGSDAVLAVVEKDDPGFSLGKKAYTLEDCTRTCHRGPWTRR